MMLCCTLNLRCISCIQRIWSHHKSRHQSHASVHHRWAPRPNALRLRYSRIRTHTTATRRGGWLIPWLHQSTIKTDANLSRILQIRRGCNQNQHSSQLYKALTPIKLIKYLTLITNPQLWKPAPPISVKEESLIIHSESNLRPITN